MQGVEAISSKPHSLSVCLTSQRDEFVDLVTLAENDLTLGSSSSDNSKVEFWYPLWVKNQRSSVKTILKIGYNSSHPI